MYTHTTNAGPLIVQEADNEMITPLAQRLTTIFLNTDEDVRTAGTHWYHYEGAALAQSVADTCGISFEMAAAVIAVCSPRTSWEAQKTHTSAMVQHFQRGGSAESSPHASVFINRREAARRLLEGDWSVLRGPKVTAFYHNICGSTHLVTIDIWAVRAALGSHIGEREAAFWITGHSRRVLEAAYHLAAHWVGTNVVALQAVVWLATKVS